MRWIFLTLVLLNVGLGGWQLMKRQGVVAEASAQPVRLEYRPTPGVASVTLLSEAPAQAVAPTPPPEPPVVAEAVPPPAVPPVDDHALCLMFGPYEKTEDANAAISRLAAAEISSHINEIEIHLNSSFQVYLDPFASRAAAKARLEQLQAQGIDSYIIPKGELNNGIALGSFDNEDSAKEQRERLLQKGIDAKIRDSKRPLKETWVALAPGAGDKLGNELKANLLKGKNLEERQILCTAIARPENIL